MVRIVSIGKATQDVFLKSQEFDPHTEGEMIYTHLPLGLKMEVEDVTFSTGGNATNVAVTFARQGIESEYVWALGYDPASDTILKALDDENVASSHVVRNENYQAGYSLILIATNGERTILNHRGLSIGASANDLNLDSLNGADWVYPTSLGFDALSILPHVLNEAEKRGVKVMLNPAGPELADPDKLRALLESVDVLCLNKEEAQKIVAGETCEELVRHALNIVPVVIVSDGPNGVTASDGKTIIQAGLYEDVPVIDRTGAGDAFASGFLSYWAQGRSLRDSVIFASANSTSVVGQIGAKAGILHKDAPIHDMPLEEKPL